MSWFEKLMPSRIKTERRTRSVPEGIWMKCSQCGAQLYRAELERNLFVCPKCDYHMRLTARDRLGMFLDPDSGREIAEKISPEDPLRFRDSKRYRDRITQAQKNTGEKDALIAMTGLLKGQPVVACAFEFRFMGGSMGSVVGEKFSRAAGYSRENKMPLICFQPAGARACRKRCSH
jgi:acetyl-CoA carboxylase carboxyl transferase subunit beta